MNASTSLDIEIATLILKAKNYRTLDKGSLELLEGEFWELLCRHKLMLGSNLTLKQLLAVQQLIKLHLYEIERKSPKPRNRESKKETPEEIAARTVASISDYLPNTRNAEQSPVILLMGGSTYVVRMSHQDMMSFRSYMEKVRDVVSDADQLDDALWQHWESVRTYFFNDAETFRLQII